MDEVRFSDLEASCEGCEREIMDGERAIMVPIGGGGFVLVCESCWNRPQANRDGDCNPFQDDPNATAVIVNRKGV